MGRKKNTPEKIKELEDKKNLEPKRQYNKKPAISQQMENQNPDVNSNENKTGTENTEQNQNSNKSNTENTTQQNTDEHEKKIETTSQEKPVEKTQEQKLVNESELQGKGLTGPFAGNPEGRAHSRPIIDHTLTKDIPEPDFNVPDPKVQIQSEQAKVEAAQPLIPPSPEIQNLTPDEKQAAAEQLTDLVLSGYDKLHSFARWYLTVDEEKLQEAQLEGRIDLNMEVRNLPDRKTGRDITVQRFFDGYNQTIKEDMVVDKELIAEIRPAMIRTCVKHNWGVSDDAYIFVKLGVDVATKFTMVIGLKKTANKMFKICEQLKTENAAALQMAINLEKRKYLTARAKLAGMENPHLATEEEITAAENTPKKAAA